MALKATICKAELQVADMDRGHYADYALTLARHPSETDARMMVRLLAFARHADERLAFTKGLCAEDEPELWRQSLGGEIEQWIDFGQLDEKRIRRACGRAREVWIYTYQPRAADIWYAQIETRLTRHDNLGVISLDEESVAGLAAMAQRSMRLQCSIQDGQIGIGDGAQWLQIEPLPRRLPRG